MSNPDFDKKQGEQDGMFDFLEEEAANNPARKKSKRSRKELVMPIIREPVPISKSGAARVTPLPGDGSIGLNEVKDDETDFEFLHERKSEPRQSASSEFDSDWNEGVHYDNAQESSGGSKKWLLPLLGLGLLAVAGFAFQWFNAQSPSNADSPIAATPLDSSTSGTVSLFQRFDDQLKMLEAMIADGKLNEAEQAITDMDRSVYGYGAPEFAELEKRIAGLKAGLIEPKVDGETVAEATKAAEVARNDDVAPADDVAQADVLALARQQAEAEQLAEAERELAAQQLAQEQQAESERLATAEKLAEDQRIAEEKRLAEVQATAERLAAEQQQAEALRLNQERLAEEQRQAEATRIAEEQKLAEATRAAENKKQAELARLAEEKRQAELARVAEEKKQIELARVAAEKKQAAEAARLAEEQRQAAEDRQAAILLAEQQRVAAQAQQQEAERQATADRQAAEALVLAQRQADQQRQLQAAEKERIAAAQRAATQRKAEQARAAATAAVAAEKARAAELELAQAAERSLALATAKAGERLAQEQRAERAETERRLAERNRLSNERARAVEFARSQVAAREAEQAREQLLIVPKTNSISDADFDFVSQQFHRLKVAIEQRDIAAVIALTDQSGKRIQQMLQLFENNAGVKARVTNTSSRVADGMVVATLRIEKLTKKSGASVKAPANLSSIALSSKKGPAGWSAIKW